MQHSLNNKAFDVDIWKGWALKQMERREAIFDRERDQKKGMRT